MRAVSRWVVLLVVIVFAAQAFAVCPAQAPTLEVPAENATVPFGSVGLDWSSVPAATFDVWLRYDGDVYTSPQLTVNAPTSAASVSIGAGRSVFWKVHAKAPSCPDQISAEGHFHTSCPTNAPNLQLPLPGRSFDVGESITFNWTATPGAASYDLKLTPDFGQTWQVFAENINGTSFVTDDIPVGDWGWEIRANFDGACGPLYSEPSHFFVVSCPTEVPAIVGPANGATVEQPFELDWSDVAATEYRVWIKKANTNDAPAVLGSTTRTAMLISGLDPGQYSLAVSADFGSCGKVTSTAITVNVAAVICGDAPPQLVSPANGATNVASPVTFQWSAAPHATAYVLLVGIGDATRMEPYGATDGTSITRLVPNGKIYWAVTARFGPTCPEKRSEVRGFTAGAANDCPTGTITLRTPAANTEVASPVHLSWTPVAGVQFYRVWAEFHDSAPAIVARTTATEADVNFPRGLIEWFVEGVRENCPPIISDESEFTVKASENCANKPAPVLLSPIGTEARPAAATSPVTLKWNPVEGALGYRVWLAKGNQPFGDLAITTQTQYATELDSGRYVWYVQALFPGCDPVDSAKAYFEIPRDPNHCTDVLPTLIAPAQNATVEANVTFRWSAVPGAEAYRVFLSRDGEETLVIGKTDDTELTRLVPPGAYIWGVEAVLQGCPSTHSARGRFSVARGQNCANVPPQLLTPANGATLTENPVEFSWSPVSGAIRYGVIVEIDEGAETLIGLTEDTHLSRKLPAGTVEWWVIVFFANCDPIETDDHQFQLKGSASCSNRAPILLVPEDGVSVPSPLRLAWTEVPRATGYKVWVVQGDGQPSVIATTAGAIATITLPPGRYEWYVEADFENCPPTESAHSSVIVTAAEACGTPRKPDAQVIGQALSNTDYRVRWTPLPNVSLYEVQESTTPDFSNAVPFRTDDFSMKFVHEVSGAPVQYLYRVRGVSDCSDARGPYSDVVGVFVVAPKTNNSSSEIGAKSAVVQKIFLPGGTTPVQFSVTTDKPWITITPSSGTLPVEGLTLTLTADPTALALGTNTGTIRVQYTSSANGVATNGTTSASIPVSISLVTPVTPTGQGTPPPDALIFPIVGHAVGANNSLFESDIRVTNLTANTMKYDVHFTPSGVDGTQTGTSSTIELAPNATLALDDIVSSLFGTGTTSSATGMLEVRPITTASSSGGFLSGITTTALRQLQTAASSRTYNFTTNGTFGQYIPAIPFADFVGRLADNGSANILSLQQVSQSSAYRSNFGFAEGSGKPVDLQVRVYDAANTLLTTIGVSLQAREHRQINGMLASAGINNLSNGRVEVQVTNGDGKVTAYVSAVDNNTNDPLLVNATLLGAASTNRTVVPGMAFLNTGAAFWVSDLRVFNSGTTATPATLTFYPQGNPGAAVTRDITVNPGEIKVLDNVVGSLFAQPNGAGGSITITTPQAAPLVATARTYNQTSNGTYGQFIPGVTPAQSAGLGDRALQILQLEQSSRIRTNIGLAETIGAPVTLEVSAVVPDSIATPVVTIPLAANEFRQISLADFGFTDAVYNARVTVKVVAGTGKVTAYGSAIDQITQDPTYVPSQ